MGELELTKKEEKELVLKGLLSTPFITVIASVLTTFIIGAIFFKFAGPVPVSITQTTVDSANFFEVLEEGSVQAIPDQARVTLGITSLRSTVVGAQEDINSLITNLKTQLKQINIEEQNIKTIAYSVLPSYEEGRSRLTVSNYNATSNLEVRVKDLEKLSEVLDIASRTGINVVGPIVLAVSDDTREKLEDKARSIAVEKAKKKAERIARESGLKLGKLINVAENVSKDLPASQVKTLSGQEEDAQTEITPPATTDITVRVTLSFETL